MTKTQIKSIMALVSPIIILIAGNVSARFFRNHLGNWAWTGYFPIYWSMLFLVMAFTGKRKGQSKWFQRSQGSRWWLLPAIGVGLLSFPVLLLPNIRIMHSVALVIAWMGFAVINSFFEETYWRGFLLDETAHMHRSFGVVYSTLFFTAIHPVNLGVFSKIQSFDPLRPMALVPFLIILTVLSLVWSLLYQKTKSLRLSILSHILTDLGNLSVFLFMNIVQL